ncbi:uncharacterized protein LOC128990067 [Macrosteles quadrilineatus]|uniref:uncharacterized protein LOC128990067 n=1 Tax=Macrosteles quadrilineatus TaxID=74068 RepID=UPI0023E10BB8|nr:uncharacterized protein LOC128990067 [Macrosteles quadrilineatus]
MNLIYLALLCAVVHCGSCAQVFVKFLTPPHGYTHNLHINTRGVAVSKEERIYPSQSQRYQQTGRTYSRPTSPTNSYYYPRPRKPFEEYGPPPVYQREQLIPPQQNQGRFFPAVGPGLPRIPPPEPYLPTGEYMNPALMGLSQHTTEVTYDPLLITGPEAAQYVSYLFSKGELFFNLIPHERLVLMNQQDRVKNNLLPHLLASIRPGHPFFYHR